MFADLVAPPGSNGSGLTGRGPSCGGWLTRSRWPPRAATTRPSAPEVARTGAGCVPATGDLPGFVQAVGGHQGSAAELTALPRTYGPPAGTVLLGVREAQISAGIAQRDLHEESWQMRALFVAGRFQGQGTGRLPCQRLLDTAAKGTGSSAAAAAIRAARHARWTSRSASTSARRTTSAPRSSWRMCLSCQKPPVQGAGPWTTPATGSIRRPGPLRARRSAGRTRAQAAAQGDESGMRRWRSALGWAARLAIATACCPPPPTLRKRRIRCACPATGK